VSDLLDPKDVERVARILCRQCGGDPDAPIPGGMGDKTPSWFLFRSNAKELIATIRAMQPAPLPVVRFKDGERDV
jgi:hypothetical protein